MSTIRPFALITAVALLTSCAKNELVAPGLPTASTSSATQGNGPHLSTDELTPDLGASDANPGNGPQTGLLIDGDVIPDLGNDDSSSGNNNPTASGTIVVDLGNSDTPNGTSHSGGTPHGPDTE
ncbi:MAG TPA: hypothetical protein PKK49_12055 [Flavobacteriales bacterium]|nr:hypothetical protein [Flavobacteriales bacterium]HMW95882.1 hypothetical protein [Flavobacteriales bacterium]HNO06019.1 hypothetical protein [Flavobacteriales bacterium]